MSAFRSRMPSSFRGGSRSFSSVYRRGNAGSKTRLSTPAPTKKEPKEGLFTRQPNRPPQTARHSAAAETLYHEIRRGKIDPVAVLKERKANDTLDIGTVRVCIDARSTFCLANLSRADRIARSKVDFIGSTTLDWLWKDDQRWSTVLQHYPAVFRSLCNCLVAEGNQHYISTLMKLDKPAHVRLEPRWRGFMLRALIKAELENTLGTNADRALDTYFKISQQVRDERHGRKYQARDDTFGKTSLWPALSELDTALASGAWPKTTASKHLDLMRVRAQIINRKDYGSDGHARMSLFIPGAPDHRPALAAFKEMFANRTDPDRKAQMPSNPSGRAYIYFLCRRLEELLETERIEDARWVRHLREQLFTSEDLVGCRDSWRRMLRAFGLKDPGYDLERLVTWDPESYWFKQREEELRLHTPVE